MNLSRQETHQERIRQECIRQIGRDRLRVLHKKSPGNFLLTVSHVWLSLLISFVVGVSILKVSTVAFVLLYLPLAFFIATRINALNVQVHEGSHGLLAESRSVNDLLCNWLAAYPTLYDVDQYAAVHTRHHQYLNQAGDPELTYYQLPASRRGLLWVFVQDFFWVTLVRRLGTIGRALVEDKQVSFARMVMHLMGRLSCTVLMLGTFYFMWGWHYALLGYFLLWLLPLFSIYPMLIRLRQVAEHYAPSAPVDGQVFVARTTRTGFLEHYLLGAQMEYHFEHHLFPLIPYKNLPQLHEHLCVGGLFQSSEIIRPEHSLSPGYLRFWRDNVWSCRALAGRAA